MPDQENGIILADDSPLNPRQQLFLQYYNDPKSETYGNGRRSYMKAYGVTNEDTADVNASKLLSNTKGILRDYLKRVGMSEHRYTGIAIKNAADFNRKDQHKWWESLGKLTGIINEQPVMQTVNNTQINVTQDTKTAADWNEQFARFLESGQANAPAITPKPDKET